MSTAIVPKYELVKRSLIDEIEQGVLAPGATVPSEAELVARFKVSRPTLIRSLQDLVRDGYVYRKQGKGTFVSERLPSQDEKTANTTQSLPMFVADCTARLSGDAREVLLRFIRGVESGLSSGGMNLNFRSCGEGELDAETQRYLDLTPPGRALVVEPSFFPQLWKQLVSRGWQLWALNEPIGDAHSVLIDQEHAGLIATRHLINCGCKRIALLNGPREKFWGFAARYDGYRRALSEAGIPFDSRLSLEGSHVIDSEAGRAMMRQLINSGVPFDGIVAVTDSKAIGAMMVAEEAKLAIGTEVRFVSIDDTCADRAPYPLSSVAMPFEEAGRVAARMAMSSLALPVEVAAIHRILLKPTLVER
jgi:GntR family transcriptional regulator, arabinose operon transcriptional repressor